MCKTRSVNCVRHESERNDDRADEGDDNETPEKDEEFFALKVIYEVDDVASASRPSRESYWLGSVEMESGNPVCVQVKSTLNEKNTKEEIETVKLIKSVPLKTELIVGGKMIVVEIDTGASVTVMSEMVYKQSFTKFELQSSHQHLQTINHDRLVVVGQFVAPVELEDECVNLKIVVIRSNFQFDTLIGRNWLDRLIPEWRNMLVFKKPKEIKQVVSKQEDFEQKIIQLHGSVFKKSLSPIKNYEVHVQIKSGAVPVFRKPYNVPFALRDKVKQTLEEMVRDKIIFPVTRSDWASPIVVIEKKNGDLRICTDFKGTVNKVIDVDTYPIPHVEDIFAVLSGGRFFSVLDLSGAYQQLKIAEESQKYFTINTPFGLFRYTRLTYGIASAPAIFQRVMEEILKGIPKVCVYLDDILATGRCIEEAQEVLEVVLRRLREYNVQVNAEKCQIF
jgi:Reverse transcriptase (RNA-dependent DNA polymerase)